MIQEAFSQQADVLPPINESTLLQFSQLIRHALSSPSLKNHLLAQLTQTVCKTFNFIDFIYIYS